MGPALAIMIARHHGTIVTRHATPMMTTMAARDIAMATAAGHRDTTHIGITTAWYDTGPFATRAKRGGCSYLQGHSGQQRHLS